MHTIRPPHPRVPHPRIQPTANGLYSSILYNVLEHQGILASAGVLEPIPRGNRGMMCFKTSFKHLFHSWLSFSGM